MLPEKNRTGTTLPIYKRKIAVCILLSVVTLGCYSIYWRYLLVKNTRELKDQKSDCTGEMLLLLFVPFYAYYWWYSRGKLVKENSRSAVGNGVLLLILCICGLELAALGIMQYDFNALPKADPSDPLVTVYDCEK